MANKKTKMSFEDAIKELESIVTALERNEIALEESITLFSRGVELAGVCNSILESIEGKITKLVESKDSGNNTDNKDNTNNMDNMGNIDNKNDKDNMDNIDGLFEEPF